MKKHLILLSATLCAVCFSCSSSPDSKNNDEPPVNPPVTDTPDVKDVTDKNSVAINGDELIVSQDLTRGGAICYISKKGAATNIVNIADEGRYIQQSYYAGNNLDRRDEGQGPSWSPWPWNPIQVGDYKRNRAKILKATIEGNTTYVKCTPMLWDMDNKPAEATMEQWTTLEGNTIHVKNRLTCYRTDDIYGEGILRDQEVPAVYIISSLKKLYAYTGDNPFTGDNYQQLEVVQLTDNPNGGGGVWGRYHDVPEQWMAFVNDSNWGLAVYSPSATEFAAGRSDSQTNGTSTSPSTSYIAPIRKETLMKNSVVEYEYYLIVDNIDNIRKRIYEIKGL